MQPLTCHRNSARHRKGTIYLFCSHPIAQQRFTHLLERTELHVVVSCELRLPKSDNDVVNRPQLCVAVIDRSDLSGSLEFVRELHIKEPAIHVLVLLPALDDSTTYPLLRLGVKGLLTYEQASRELSRAALQVAEGGYWVPRELLTRFVESILPELRGAKSLDSQVEISRREREVLDLLLDNLANKEIASKLFVSERTVKFHVSNLLSKFHVQRRSDLIVLWMQRTSSFPPLGRELGKTLSAQVN